MMANNFLIFDLLSQSEVFSKARFVPEYKMFVKNKIRNLGWTISTNMSEQGTKLSEFGDHVKAGLSAILHPPDDGP